MKRSIDWLPVACFALIGLVYLFASFQIVESFSGGYGHRTMPLAMTILILLLCARIAYTMWKKRAAEERDADCHPIWLDQFATKVLPLIAFMIIYGLFQTWFGYLIATFASGVAVFRLFGNGWISCAVNSAIGAAVIYLLFFKLLNLYDPPGTIIDIAGLI